MGTGIVTIADSLRNESSQAGDGDNLSDDDEDDDDGDGENGGEDGGAMKSTEVSEGDNSGVADEEARQSKRSSKKNKKKKKKHSAKGKKQHSRSGSSSSSDPENYEPVCYSCPHSTSQDLRGSANTKAATNSSSKTRHSQKQSCVLQQCAAYSEHKHWGCA